MLRVRSASQVVVGILILSLLGCARRPHSEHASHSSVQLPNRLVHVFCYHNITARPTNDYDVSVASFTAQLKILQKAGYRSISCRQLADYLANVKDIPDKSVLITFDDGWASVAKVAHPLLDKYGFTATVFLITGSVGSRAHLSWNDVKELAAAGYEFGSHTATHPNLVHQDPNQAAAVHATKVRREFEESYRVLEEKLGAPPVAVAYPNGNYDDLSITAARNAGYRLGFTIDPGAIDSKSTPWMLPRRMVVKGTSLRTFERSLAVEPLHLTAIQPARGEHIKSHTYQLSAQVQDPDAVNTLTVQAGEGTRFKVDQQTSRLTVTSTLRHRATQVRVSSTGMPRRETAWIVVFDP